MQVELHRLLAQITCCFLLATAATGVMLFIRKPKGLYKQLRIAHAITGFLTLLFFLLTYLSAPK